MSRVEVFRRTRVALLIDKRRGSIICQFSPEEARPDQSRSGNVLPDSYQSSPYPPIPSNTKPPPPSSESV